MYDFLFLQSLSPLPAPLSPLSPLSSLVFHT
jgi:hypothetical protein